MTTMASIDDLFRQKTLQEIHGVLRQTRADVETKKQELRELVGDHYRSVLESSDHIRAMSECAAKVSSGADHIEELIASMRSLAANPPALSTGLVPEAQSHVKENMAEADHEYRVSLRVMELLEVPDTVGSHLNAHAFVRAARVALIDAVTLQSEVDELLRPGVRNADGSAGAFNFGALARQQAAAFRSLPSQISASCEDAFSAVSLESGSAAESFAVRLVLDASAQPAPLLKLFLERRRELLRSLLASGGTAEDGTASASRVAAAAVAFEGTIVLGASLCTGALETALASVYDGAPDRDALEERAAIQGQSTSGTGFSSLRRRGESLGVALRRGGTGTQAMLMELGQLGSELAGDWVPLDADGLGCKSGTSSGSNPRSLANCFLQLVSSDGSMRACVALGETLKLCTEKVLSYRRVLAKGSSESWSTIWTSSCSQFCPGRPPLDDALSIVTATIEAACIELARERIGDLQLELVPAADDDVDAINAASPAAGDAGGERGGGEMQRRAEVTEMQRQSRLRVQRLDEQLGEVLEDLQHVAPPGGETLSSGISAALLEALCERLSAACEAVRLPTVTPLWPSGEKDSNSSSESRSSWPRQRSAARAAIALDALLAAAVDDREEPGTSHLRATLRSASSSGDASLMRQAQSILKELEQRSDVAYNVWARLAVSHGEGTATLGAYWRLADDEVPHACGWGNARFASTKDGGSDESSKAVPVPVQASSFIFERLALGARRALEVGGGFSPMSRALVVALKVALSEEFMAAYEAHPIDFASFPKASNMSHLLQWLFDLRFLQIALSTGAGGKAYEALCELHDRVETTTLSDHVDWLIYQEVLKSAVKGHIDGVKILLAPFFQHNPRYGFLFPGQSGGGMEWGAPVGAGATPAVDEGFELQTTFAPPLRPMLPQRFPLLPVAMTSALIGGSTAELDARLGLSSDSAERAAARMSGANPSAPSVSSLMQSVGSGLGNFGFGKNWTSGWGGGTGTAKAPQAV